MFNLTSGYTVKISFLLFAQGTLPVFHPGEPSIRPKRDLAKLAHTLEVVNPSKTHRVNSYSQVRRTRHVGQQV